MAHYAYFRASLRPEVAAQYDMLRAQYSQCLEDIKRMSSASRRGTEMIDAYMKIVHLNDKVYSGPNQRIRDWIFRCSMDGIPLWVALMPATIVRHYRYVKSVL